MRIALQILAYNHLAPILQGHYQKASAPALSFQRMLQRINFMSSWEENCSSNSSEVIQ